MDSISSEENVNNLAETKILLGKELIEQLNAFKNIAGVQKIQRKINQEIKFLQKAKTTNALKLNHVMCSNLTHYEFLVQVLTKQYNIIHVDCGFSVDDRNNPIRVDIVCDNGLKWIKVIARNSKSISDAAKGGVSFGVKSIVDQAEEYVKAASQNLCMFKQPQIVFYFSHNIDLELLNEIEECGIETMTNNSSFINTMLDTNKNQLENNEVLNLDITTMLAYVSALTNGQNNWIFEEPLLTDQATRERETPLKPILDNLFKEKRLICCQTALHSFQDIISILAGPEERKRADSFVDRLEILPDLNEIPKEFSRLELCGKIKPRSLNIFAFGMERKAITVTSNEGFIRSSKMQGINVPVFIHQARALTESKQETALPMQSTVK